MAKKKDVKEILAQRDNELKEAEAKATKEMAESVKEFCEEDKAKKTESEPASTKPKTDEPEPEKKPAPKQKTPTKEEAPKEEPKEEVPKEEPKEVPKEAVPKETLKDEPKEAVLEEEPKKEAPVEVLPATEMANLEMAVSDNCKLGFGRPRTIEGPGKAFQYFSREYGEWKLTPNYWWATQFGSGDIQVVLVYYKDGKIDHLLTEREAEKYI